MSQPTENDNQPPLELHLAELTNVYGGRLDIRPLIPGSLRVHPGGASQTLLRMQHLLMVLASHHASLTLAEDHNIGFTEENGVLEMIGHRDSEPGFMLACWKNAELRPFFDLLELKVVE